MMPASTLEPPADITSVPSTGTSNLPLVKIWAATAAEICTNFFLPRDARRTLRRSMSPREFLDALLAKKQYTTGIDFIAHALPARDAIWWGCLCFQYAFGEKLTAADRAACTAAVLWVWQPTEVHRVAAKEPADLAGPHSAAGALAMAVYQTGGSLAPPNMPVKPPSPFAPAKAVAISVKVASLRGEKAKLSFRQKSFVELGIAAAEGRFF